MSALSRTSYKITALAIPALALLSFAGCASEDPGTEPGTGGSIYGTGGTQGMGGGVGMGGYLTTGGALVTGGAFMTGGALMTGGVANMGGGIATGGVGTGGGATGGGSNFECTLPNLPEGNSLTYENQKLPDPFTFYDGTPVTTKEQWECRRKEILAMAAKYLYAPVPPAPDQVTGTVNGGSISISATVGSKTESFTATISGNGDVITLDLTSGILPSSKKSLSFGAGYDNKIRSLYGYSELNNNIAQGWMVDRVIDVLEQNPNSGHDPTKMAVSGCSGCGKGAYLVGIFSRIPMTVIVESGGGGAASLRQAEWFRHGDGGAIWQCADAKPQSIDNLEDNGACGPWVTSAAQWLRSNPSKVYNLPFDTHLLLATIAPRYLVHFSNNNGVNSWCHLGGTCEALAAWAAKPVWNALGVPDNMAFEMYNGSHCFVGDTGIAAAMFRRAFQGDTTTSTGGVTIPSGGVQQPVSEWQTMWVDWNMETVLQ